MIIAVQAVFLRMFIAHLIGDFYLQKDEWVEDKRENIWRSKKLYIHSFLVAALTYLFSGLLSALWIIPLIFVTHAAIDILKVYLDSKGKMPVFSFIFDQVLHILVLFGIIVIIKGFNGPDLAISTPEIFENLLLLTIIAAYLIIIRPSGFLINCALKPLRDQITASENKKEGGKVSEVKYGNLENAGRLIGYLERILVLTFVIINQYAAIGFLITAKSIFRFRENRNDLVEYYLLGTFLSMTIVILAGLGTLFSLAVLSPGSLNELMNILSPSTGMLP